MANNCFVLYTSDLHDYWMFCRLRNDMQNIIQIVSSDTSKKKGSVGNGDGEKKECKEDGEHGEKTEADGLVIITALVTSCIR